MPPDIVNNDNKRIIKGKYSNSKTCISWWKVSCNPSKNKDGITKDSAQKADIFPKLWCQNIGANKGIMAIDNKIPRNGNIEYNGKFSPKPPVAG